MLIVLPVLRSYNVTKIIRKDNQTIKVTSQFTDRNQIKRTIKNIKDKSEGKEEDMLNDSFSHSLRFIS